MGILALAFDLLILLILALCVWHGYKRGLISAVVGIVVIVIAFYASNLLANAYSGEFAPMIKSFISGYVDTKLEDAKDEVVSEELQEYSIEDIITMEPDMEDEISTEAFINLGVISGSAEKLAKTAREHKDEMGVNLAAAIAHVASNTMAYLIVMCVAIILIIIVFTVIANITNITLRIPGKKKIDSMAGLAAGFLRGIMVITIASWVVGFSGVIISPETVERTVLLEFFVNHNIASLLV